MGIKKRKFLKYTFKIDEGDKRERLILALSQFPFEGFLEEDHEVQSFVSNDRWMPEHIHGLNNVATEFNMSFDLQEMPGENWNKEWEKNFRPVHIPNTAYIRASFHSKKDIPKGVTDIVIDPKMAFGTGHHATTKLMLQEMRKIDFSGERVLDFGAGTGILSIAALKWGAKKVHAVEVEDMAIENIKENIAINGLKGGVKLIHGTVVDIPDKKYPIVLANVNKRVLIDSAKRLYRKMRNGGIILLSGVLEADRKEVVKTYQNVGFKSTTIKQEGDWLMIRMRKR